jgi:transcriptional regulator with XRE-family HTH domain
MTFRMVPVARLNLIYREFGLVLATARKRKHLTQSQFAARAGLSRTSITNIECGRQPVQLHQLYLFAGILRVPAQSLLPREQTTELQESKDKSDEQVQYLIDAKRLFAKVTKPLKGDRNG